MDKCDQACAYIQSIMNQNNNGVIIQRGAGRISIPDTMANMTPLRWADILDQVPGANNDPDMKKAIKQAVCNRYGVDHLGLPGWVQLHG
jgi:hypothetical protein